MLDFILTHTAESPNSAYIQFLVDVDDPYAVNDLIATIEDGLVEVNADATVFFVVPSLWDQPRAERSRHESLDGTRTAFARRK